ncbi:unnamed protein product [Aphanomyces euteiches]|uniref:Uncharacterized protein n=1 Tax=Aphanomyces euteiches TaxID=100861 RepID=A0A6G0WX17_9STRA|nr:hypothetical protein Ae201684_010691 [Aphanomyces euteiches]KAH9153204.1 hypothetical protein AeRB84_004502 [Aphanomyces euteiches]
MSYSKRSATARAMKKSVFLAYAEDSDDDTTFSRHQGDRSAKNSKHKQKQKAKKQEDNSLKNLAMSTSKKSKKKKNATGNAAGENDDVIAPAEEAAPAAAAVDQITVELEKTTIETPPPATISYAQASASTKPQAKQQQPPKQHTKQPVQQPQPKSQPVQQPQTSKPPGPTPPAPERQKAVQPPTPERVTTPPPNGVHTVNEVTYLPSQIKVLLPGQPEQVLDVAEVMQRAQYFKQTAESLLAVNRNGEMENAQLREHLAQALVRLEQLEHDNRVLQQLNLNLQTELARLKPFNNGIRPPGL